MSRFVLTFCLGAYALLGGATTMQGQERDDSAEYDARALRTESELGSWTLVRGRDGALVGKLGAFRGGLDLPSVVAPSPNAVREAQDFTRSYKRGGLALGVGIAALGVGGGVARIDGVDAVVSISATVVSAAGIVLVAYGAKHLNNAYAALARSIWWYNRDLAR